MRVSVDKYERKLSESEKILMNQRIMPINEVTIEHSGFSFDEIQKLLENIQTQLPAHIKDNFVYSVDFNKLSVD